MKIKKIFEKKERLILYLAIPAIVLLLYWFIIIPFHVLNTPQLKMQDIFFKLRYLVTEKPDLKDTVLVTIDDESIKNFDKKWPLNRSVYADLLNIISEVEPQVVGMDFIFSGKEDPLNDFLLKKALTKLNRVVLGAFVDESGHLIYSEKDFRDSARGMGMVNKFLDKDLYVRRGPVFYRDAKGELIGWPWEFQVLNVIRPINFEKVKDLGDEVVLDAEGSALRVPLERDARRFLINYRFKLKDIPTYSFWEILEKKGAVENLRGKIVLIGTTSKALHDYYQTSFGFMPGIVINANMLTNLRSGDYLLQAPLWLNAFCLLLMISLSVFFAYEWNVLKGVIAFVVSAVIFYLIAFMGFIFNFTLDSFIPLFLSTLLFLMIVFYRYFRALMENVNLRSEVVHDPLTGAYNRRYLEVKMDEMLEELASESRKRRSDQLRDITVIMTDIDNFKRINDTYGHQFGDDVLKVVSFTISQNIRQEDILARYGGEEFCVVLADATKKNGLMIAEKIREAVANRKFNYVNKVEKFTISLGLATAREDELYASRAMIKAADDALYRAKKTGKNKVCYYKQEENNQN